MASSKDVAKRAGVSQTTVSRVLNKSNSVSPETKEKVLQAIEELGYVPDANARGLVSQKTSTIALISGPLHNPFFVDSTSEIIRYANQLGYRVNVHFTDGDMESVYDAVLSHKVDGLIMSCILYRDPIIYRFQKLQLPVMSFNRRHESFGNYVEMDNFQAGVLAIRHLLALGHRHILWIGGESSKSTFRDRYRGVKYECERSFFQDKRLRLKVVNYKQTDQLDLTSMMEKLQVNMPTAICAATDAIAIEVMNCLSNLGLSVPDDVSVIGIDNVRLSATPLVQLTTVGVADQTQLGEIAIRALIEQIENKSSAPQETIRIRKDVALFQRKTTKSLL